MTTSLPRSDRRALGALLALVLLPSSAFAGAAPGSRTGEGVLSGSLFYPIPPCRLLDTRNPNGSLGGPSLQPGVARSFVLPPTCGIPSGAAALSVNATVTNTTGLGQIVLYPGDIAVPGTSNVSFGNRQTRAVAVLVPLAADGTVKVLATGAAADFILDVSGYFLPNAPPAIVTLDSVPDQTIPTNTTLSLRLSGHSTDALDALTYGLVAGPAGASVSPLGVFAFAPTQGQLGPKSVTVQVHDGGGRSAQATFQINVVDHDHPPVMGPLPDDLTRVGASYTKTLTATDPDFGDTLTFTLLSGPAGMTLSGSTLSWTPTAAQLGSWPVQVKVTDRAGLSSSGQFRVAIQFLVATDDAYQVTLGQTLTVNAPGVLANDLDPLSGPLTAAKLTNPDKGTLNSFNADGGLVYQAPPTLPGPVFAPVVKYHVDANLVGSDPPLVADVDGDGKPELIIAGPGIAAVRGTDGTVLWNTLALPAPYDDCEVYAGGGGVYHLAVGDIDDSGQLSIVTATTCGRDNLPTGIVGTNAARYLALNARDGTVKWLSPPLSRELDAIGNPDNLAFGTVPTLARVRPGETPSIVVGNAVSYFSFNGKPECDQLVPGWPAGMACRGIFVLDGKDGSVRQRMAAPTNAEYDRALPGNGTQAAVVADLDGDGNIEFVFGGAVFNNDGSVRSNNNPDGTGYGLTFWTGLGNFDETPDIEIARLEGSGFGYRLIVYKSDGRQLWSLPLPATGYTGKPVIADVDGSGRPAVVFNVDGNVCAIDYRGNYKWCHDVGAPAGVSNVGLGTRLQVYDLDGDGVPEVIVPVKGEILLFLDGATGNVKYSLDMDAANGPPNSVFGSYGVGGPVLADFDGSGHAAIAQLWYDGYTIGPRLDVVKALNNDWRPVRSIYNQESYQFGNINDDGTMPKFFVNNFATPATNVFGTQPQLLTPVDPRLKSQTSFTYTASDGALTSAPGTVTITILPTNRPPVFVSTPPTRFLINSAFSYAAQAIDPDPGDTVTYSVKLAQGNGAGSFGNCTIGASSGLLSCVILFSGEQDFVIVATDSFGAAVYQNIKMFDSAGPAAVPNVVGQLQAAAGLTLTGAGFTTGNVTTIDNPAPVGQVVQQVPGAGAQALLGSSVDLVVSKGPSPPPPPPGPPPGLGNIKRIVVTPASTLHVVGDNVPYKATSINNDGTGADITAFVVWSSTATAVATVNAVGVAHAAGPGATILTATAGGLSGQATLSVAARANSDFTPPTAIITQPASGGTVTGLTQVLGTATDAHFLRYELALEASGDTTFNLIGQGTTQVTNGVLGTLDPTLLLNGAYTLRLTVFDANGNSTTADVPIAVDGGQKVGNFTLAYTDLVVSLSGIPIQIQRTYDSRDKRTGDFGVGWNLGVNALRVSASGVLGTAWRVEQQSTTFGLVPGSDHFVSVTLPSGKVETFDLRISPTTSFLTPFSTLFATFVPRSGTLGTLQSLENVNLLILDPQPGPVTLVDDSTLNTFHPDRFLYTAKGGTQFVVTRTKGVESVKDTNGNQITISAGGISHSSGTSIIFTRDGTGHITGITDPKGQTLSYAYSLSGDLASATDRAGNATRYFYNAQHGLVRIEDPLGRPVARTDYDDDGRLISITDAIGHTTTYNHDLPGRQEQLVDPLGRVIVVNYDQRGNPLSVTDALGNTTTSMYDDQDNLLTQTDPLGNVRSYIYDAGNNLLTQTDPLGHTTVYTRDSAGRELTRTDARGKTVSTRYDANGKIVGTTDALGNTTSSAYDAAGNLTVNTDSAGATSSNQYDGIGRRTQVVDPLGNATGLQYDSGGNLLSQQSTSGAPWALTYDPNGQITGTSFGSLSRTITRDASNVISNVTTAAGLTISVASDPAGRFTGLTDPAGTQLRQQSYDEVGNIQSTTDPIGNQTHFVYDAANRLTSATLADGTIVRTAYDADGRSIQSTDPLGRVTSYQYDAAGQLATQTNALGGQTQYQYDAVGNPVAVTDPAGRTTTYTYDAANQVVGTTFADGTTESRVYDSAGRVVQSTDAAGRSTAWIYDSLGRLVTVTDPLGNTATYQYQGAGPRTGLTDANGKTTTFAYDDHARLTQTTHPLGDTESATYDAAGHFLSQTNGAGETVQYQYDSQGRLARVLRPDGTTFAYTYTVDNLVDSVRDARGLTLHSYDPATRRLVRVTEPDARYVRYQYDAAGNRTLVAHGDVASELVTTYSYDSLNRLVVITDPNSGVTTQSYDAVGNVTSVTRPNGVTTTTTFDVRSRPVTIVSRDSGGTLLQQHSYTFDALGNRTRVDAFDGSHVDYQYDALSRIVHERHFDASAVLQLDLTYGYDPAGNLVSAGPAASPVSFTFNADNELVSGGGVTYAYDLAGRRVQESFNLGGPTLFRNYTWDADDRLTSFRDTSGATTTYVYDDAGVRQSKGGATGPVTFLTDRSSASGFSQILRETSLSGTNTFVWGSRLFETIEAGSQRFHLFDSLGSTRVLTGVSGAVTDTFTYKAYGELLSHVGGSGVRHRFAGEETDLESGLTYLRARYYDPRTGSFLTRDPAEGDDFDPLSFHPYAYASGNPVNRTDPSGRSSLAELMVTMSTRFVATAQQVYNYRVGFISAEQDVAKVMQAAGGILAVEALLEETIDDRAVLQWFGGLLGNVFHNSLPSPNPLNLDPSAFFGDIGEAASLTKSGIKLAAAVALLKGATDLFNPYKATFEIQVLPPAAEKLLHGESPSGVNDHGDSAGNRWCGEKDNEGAHAAASGNFSVPGAPTWTVSLCRPFFTDRPLPVGMFDSPSMAGVMVHEFMHITAARLIRDDVYGCGHHRVGKKATVKENAIAAAPGMNLFSADSYRCWVESVATGAPGGLSKYNPLE